MDQFLVVWVKMTLLHHNMNRHFVSAPVQAASMVAEVFSTFAQLSRYCQTRWCGVWSAPSGVVSSLQAA